MGRHMDPPPFPVVEEEPTFRQTIAAFRSTDWRNFALATGLSLPYGYFAGTSLSSRAPAPLRAPPQAYANTPRAHVPDFLLIQAAQS